MLFLSLTN